MADARGSLLSSSNRRTTSHISSVRLWSPNPEVYNITILSIASSVIPAHGRAHMHPSQARKTSRRRRRRSRQLEFSPHRRLPSGDEQGYSRHYAIRLEPRGRRRSAGTPLVQCFILPTFHQRINVPTEFVSMIVSGQLPIHPLALQSAHSSPLDSQSIKHFNRWDVLVVH